MRHLRALAEAGMTTVHLLPCNDIATIEEDRSRQLDPGPLDHLPPDSDEQQRRVGAVRERDGFNWGYDPLHFFAPEGSYAADPRDRTREFRAMVRRAQRDRPARRARRRLQPHAGRGPASVLDPRPDRPRLLPPALSGRRGRELDVLRQHRERAPDDGEADARLARAVGARVPRRRLSLRPDGPPHEGQSAGGARAARPGGAPLRRGLELRRGRRRRAVRRRLAEEHGGHGDRHVQRRAARRRPRRRPTRRGPDDRGLRHRRAPAAKRSSSSGSPDICSRTATPRSPRTRSPTSTRTTTRRCSTRSPSSCRGPRAWTTASA